MGQPKSRGANLPSPPPVSLSKGLVWVQGMARYDRGHISPATQGGQGEGMGIPMGVHPLGPRVLPVRTPESERLLWYCMGPHEAMGRAQGHGRHVSCTFQTSATA